MSEVSGDKLKVRITPSGGAPVAYKAARVSWSSKTGIGNISNSEVEGYMVGLPCKRQLTVTVSNASYDPTLNAFQGPLNIQDGLFLNLVIYPAGLDEDPLGSLTFLVEEVSGEHDANSVEGLAPITFRGASSGDYYLPGDEG
jgi:hypothetical protein